MVSSVSVAGYQLGKILRRMVVVYLIFEKIVSAVFFLFLCTYL